MRFIRFFMFLSTMFFSILVASSITMADVVRSDFTEEKFKSLQAENKLILVDVYATWCPTCAKQKKILQAYGEERPEAELHVLIVDFDDQKEWVKYFMAPRQSTLLLYKGEERVWFSVAEKRKDKIFAALDDAVKS